MKRKNEKGKIISYFSGVAKIEGINSVSIHEVLMDKSERPVAMVIGFDEESIDALFFDDNFDTNQSVFATGEKFSIPISEHIVGRVINGLGENLDGYAPIQGKRSIVFRTAPQIIDRVPVSTPLTTGVKIIDTTLPLGRGQRELIIGDRKLGKSTLATDIVLNQKLADPPIICIYVLCGHKVQKLKEVVSLFEENNALLYTVVVAATADSSLAETYLAPFVGCTIGEYFRDKGQHALIIYDDLSKHAKAYRDISLLTGKAPGREAYPGDIFSLHAQILERSASLSSKAGGGTLTALPIIETEENDITAFIPTNLISITDGQIYFERGLYQKGFLPAVNVGLSVSRVGSEAQPKPLQEVTKGLRVSLSQHKELQKLAQLETKKSVEAKQKIERGELLLELLKQEKHTNYSWQEQVVLFYVVEEGYFDDLVPEHWHDFKDLFSELLTNRYFALLEKIEQKGLSPENKEEIKKVVTDFKKDFLT